MKKVIRLTESELTKIVKKIIKEGENEAFVAEMNSDLSEVGLPTISLDDLSSNEIPSSIISASSEFDLKPGQDQETKSSIFQQIQSAMCAADETQLRQAKNQLKTILKQKFGIGKAIRSVFGKNKGQGQMNEQLELGAAATVLGVSAPLWVWVAIGAVVLYLLLRLIFKKRNGYGCGGNYSWDRMIWKNTRQ